jgi:hypothetical protein
MAAAGETVIPPEPNETAGQAIVFTLQAVS